VGEVGRVDARALPSTYAVDDTKRNGAGVADVADEEGVFAALRPVFGAAPGACGVGCRFFEADVGVEVEEVAGWV